MSEKVCRNLKQSFVVGVCTLALASVFAFCPQAFADAQTLTAGTLPSSDNALQTAATQPGTASLNASAAKTVAGTYLDPLLRKTFRATAKYTDSFFTRSSTVKQPRLAVLSMVAAATAYGRTDKDRSSYSKSLLKQCGFTASYKQIDTTENDSNHASYAIGHKKVGKATVIAVWVKGTTADTEWISNFNLGSGETHEGFSVSEKEMVANVNRYIKKNKITGPIKWWVTGHSRGAAVANLYAKDLTDKYGKKNVYAYTFGTPRVSQVARKTGYGNVFNYLNPGDVITEVAPVDWGYKRYGADVTLSSKSKKLMKAKFKAMTGEKYLGLSKTDKTTLMQSILALVDYWVLQPSPESNGRASSLNDVKSVASSQQNPGNALAGTFQGYAKSSIAATSGDATAGLKDAATGEDIGKQVMHAHCPASYICWLDAMCSKSTA